MRICPFKNMNMKELLKRVSCAVLFSALAVAPFFSDAEESKSELRERFRKNIDKAENGDVVIAGFRKPENLKDPEGIGMGLVVCLAYVDPEMDFDKLSDSISHAVGKSKKPDGSMPVALIIEGAKKYLARKNMSMQQVKFSGTAAQQKIEEGLPVLCWAADVQEYYGTLKERALKRKECSDIKEWTKDLRKLGHQKIKHGKMFTQCIVDGYNKISGEFRLRGVAEDPVWITEKELKDLVLNAYIIRF